MKERLEKERGTGRKPYIRPEVKQVPLRPEEAVLGFCKCGGSEGPLQADCTQPTPCPTPGS